MMPYSTLLSVYTKYLEMTMVIPLQLRYHEFIYTGGGHEYKTAFRIIDTMGITDNYELHSNDIANIMKGHIKNQYNVNIYQWLHIFLSFFYLRYDYRQMISQENSASFTDNSLINCMWYL